jgi:hypothetical protein
MSKPLKTWYKFKGESGEQLSFDFDDDSNEWTGPFWFYGEDSEILLSELYNNYDPKKNLIYKITGEFKWQLTALNSEKQYYTIYV